MRKKWRENIKEREFIVAKEKEEVKYTKVKKEINMFKKKIKNQQIYGSPFQRNVFQDFSNIYYCNFYFNEHI